MKKMLQVSLNMNWWKEGTERGVERREGKEGKGVISYAFPDPMLPLTKETILRTTFCGLGLVRRPNNNKLGSGITSKNTL